MHVIILSLLILTLSIILILFFRIRLNRLGKYISKDSDLIEVYKLKSGEKRLLLNNSVQGISTELPSFNQSYWWEISNQAVMHLKKEKNPVILHIGLGACTIPNTINKELPGINQKIVEIEPLIIQACKDHFDLNSLKNTEIINSDIFDIINKQPNWNNYFSVIVTDLFTNNPKVLTPLENKYEFLEKLSNWLKTDGILIFARPSHTEHRIKEAQELINYLSKQFRNVNKKYVKDPRGFQNYVITASGHNIQNTKNQ